MNSKARPSHRSASRCRKTKSISPEVKKEVERAIQKGTSLVQASLEHLETAERSWDKFVNEGGHVIGGYPTAQLVVTRTNFNRLAFEVYASAVGSWRIDLCVVGALCEDQ
jgi:hypothetical protein